MGSGPARSSLCLPCLLIGNQVLKFPALFFKFALYAQRRIGIAQLTALVGGCRQWVKVVRNTLTHEITMVELARDVARQMGRSK